MLGADHCPSSEHVIVGAGKLVNLHDCESNDQLLAPIVEFYQPLAYTPHTAHCGHTTGHKLDTAH